MRGEQSRRGELGGNELLHLFRLEDQLLQRRRRFDVRKVEGDAVVGPQRAGVDRQALLEGKALEETGLHLAQEPLLGARSRRGDPCIPVPDAADTVVDAEEGANQGRAVAVGGRVPRDQKDMRTLRHRSSVFGERLGRV